MKFDKAIVLHRHCGPLGTVDEKFVYHGVGVTSSELAAGTNGNERSKLAIETPCILLHYQECHLR